MIDFILADYNLLFTCSICFVFILAFIEGVGLLIGFSLMNALDQLTPIDINTEIDITEGGITSLIGWLCLNRLPLLVWLVLLLTSFGVFGYCLNYLSYSILDIPLAGLISIPCSLFLAIYFTKFIAQPLATLLPKNESSAISNQDFVGLVAKITIGKASYENPAEAVLEDQYHQKHYLLVAPQSKNDVFIQDSEVVLIEKNEKYWLAVALNQILK